MVDEQPQSNDSDDVQFWSRMVRELQAQEVVRAEADDADLPLSPEQEQVLWEFAEGRLSESEEEQCLDLLDVNPAASRRLVEMHAALDAAETMPRNQPDAVWERATREKELAARPVMEQVGHMIIELVDAGLRLVYSAGRPAYAPALARSSGEDPITSIAHEFLTSIGTVQVVVDHTGLAACDISVILSELLDPELQDSLSLRLQNVESGKSRTATLHAGRARLENTVAGTYRLSMHDGDRELDQLRLDLKPHVSDNPES